MLSRALRRSLALEVALYVALAIYGCDASPAAAAGVALAGVLALRATLSAVTYAWAWAYHSPAPPLSPGQAVRMVLGEYASCVLSFVLIFPFERWWMAPDRLSGGAEQAAGRPGARPPVLLVHGYSCSRAAWWWLRRRLEAAGWRVATISLEPIYGSIDDFVEPLARRIAAVLAETGAERLLLVGHSMGGLVARAYLQRHGERGWSGWSPSGRRTRAAASRTSVSARTPARCSPTAPGCRHLPVRRRCSILGSSTVRTTIS
jgi:triacylglycerol lipase